MLSRLIFFMVTAIVVLNTRVYNKKLRFSKPNIKCNVEKHVTPY